MKLFGRICFGSVLLLCGLKMNHNEVKVLKCDKCVDVTEILGGHDVPPEAERTTSSSLFTRYGCKRPETSFKTEILQFNPAVTSLF